MEKGNLSINSENILPIIKKWLYSDSDIFIREIVSNAVDAITKLKNLAQMGEAAVEGETYKVLVVLDKENKTIRVEDNGIGMTAGEVKEYINQIAFSGATQFLEKFKDKLNNEHDIIGHFGLGFYSSFMVSDKVQIDTLSYKEGAQPVRWVCSGGTEYEMEDGDRQQRGTTITMHIGEDGTDFLEEFRLSSVLRKYCSFLPVEIYFEAVKKDEEKKEDTPEPTPINDTVPLWLKQPNECTDEEYKAFYHKVFADFADPLFWIHLNMDYPFRLKGILYFPKLKHELESIEGQVKLYSNQVFIADNIKEVIPEFLLLLKGALDCPDIPLNVSRSFLQNDGYVKKMSGYITKKVADKLNSIFKKDREEYNGYWDDISPFIKYGCIREKDFYDKVKESVLFKTTASDYTTMGEFLERNKEKTGDKIFYITNEQLQAQYIKMFADEGMEAVFLTTNLDNPFISYLESYEKNVQFNRIDADLSEGLKKSEDNTEGSAAVDEDLQTIFKEHIPEEKLEIKTETLKSENVSAVILQSEQARRMEEMSKMFGTGAGMPNMFAGETTLVLNKNSSLVKTLLTIKDNADKKEDVGLICNQIYDLAMMSHKPLSSQAMAAFIERSNLLLEKIAAR